MLTTMCMFMCVQLAGLEVGVGNINLETGLQGCRKLRNKNQPAARSSPRLSDQGCVQKTQFHIVLRHSEMVRSTSMSFAFVAKQLRYGGSNDYSCFKLRIGTKFLQHVKQRVLV